MFRILRAKPPNGWPAVWWELVIVTLGVLIALAAQQFADGVATQRKSDLALTALRAELAQHYRAAVEMRRVEPCVDQQIADLAERLVASGDRIDPAPLYSEPGFAAYVVRMPSRNLPASAWEAALRDGIAAQFDPALREQLSNVYTRVARLNEMSVQNDEAIAGLYGLSRPLALSAQARLDLLRQLDELRGRVEYVGLLSEQAIDRITRAGLKPTSETLDLDTSRGSYSFCADRGLPVRSLADALVIKRTG